MCFLENDIDGETVDCGLTEAMVGYLFDGSFKKQIKFQQFVRQYKEAETIVILEPVPVGVANSTAELQPTPSNDSSGEPAHKRLPVVIVIPTFPKDVQTRLDAKESCQKVPKIRHKIIRVLYEIMAEYTMYPTNAEYIQVAKALIVKYPFLRDKEGNGYDICVGEDLMSVEAHVKVLQSECSKTHPDVSSVKDLMARTFSWRRREVTEGMPVDDVLKKYPYLRMPSGLFNEVDQIHPSTSSFCARFRDCFTAVLPNVLKLAKGQSHLTKHYTDARQDALAEDLPGIDLRAGLIFLPSIFREKIEHLITVGEGDPATPYPTIQLMDNDWIMAISGRGFSVVKVDGIAVCQCTSIDEAFITAFSMYFAFNIAYPVHLKNTLTFLQRCIVSIVEEGEKPLPVTLLRKINLLY
ncbi:sterile alpha motif domain-containing protein 3-like isoform X2 [Triplophysa dalaica]|uniref:sterile alpha motif domain-containing protein 3-like isoform X2 n=1 Tax=Triplophysa dalaica TaxID=1582913 RepID=UPI0024DFCEE9|nr:sterile alpha motif domain-containing protein 3-like isoform X2 [Triplophysa dalaica]